MTHLLNPLSLVVKVDKPKIQIQLQVQIQMQIQKQIQMQMQIQMPHLPNPLSLVAKVSKPDPPGVHPGQGLLQVGKARDKLKLFRSLRLRKKAALSKARDYWKDMFMIPNLLLAVLKSLNPRESHPVC